MELYFIRHGQSENNAKWHRDDFQDVSDPELTEIGRTQANHLARFFADNQSRNDSFMYNSQNQHGFGLTHIYTSLMVRAVNTATPLAGALDLPLIAWPEIHETGGIFSRDDGDKQAGLPGKNRSYFKENYPDLVLPDWLNEGGWWNRPFESKEARKPRAEKMWTGLLARHGDRDGQSEHRVALISHGGFFMYLFTTAIGIDMRKIDDTIHEYWFTMNNCSITRLDIDDKQVVISYVNRNDYLPKHLIT